MARVDIDRHEMRVRFSLLERLATWRGEVLVPLTAVREVAVLERPVSHARGGRTGLLISGVLKIGIWGLGTEHRQLVSVRRQTPALRVRIDRAATGHGFDELLISTPRAAELAQRVASPARM
ncbi:hypothetical protein HPO96_09875 [Kribbella sandramycini]|uniref:PH (Pleckstrin Homology) domain-containing protein n=1 Tax=Kribbella sandramycini TaxID=60450 RepID=A0A7Y4NYI1_9ACTN|nr:hypothetical protein [Kribbella sandramycini]MBB6569615.1 hypothetical protein [Kribbella sandramycini]NOL40551.1 hypothetical protein [Kribbella sandramycini]